MEREFGMKRYAEGMTGKSGLVIAGGLAYIVVFDPKCEEGITKQTRNSLQYLDELLERAGSGRDKLLQVTVYLSDFSDKQAMDAVWNPWIGGPENWPQRACVGVDLSPDYLIEIVVIAQVS